MVSDFLRTSTLLVATIFSGALLDWLGFPLPWLIGAILAAALLGFAGLRYSVPRWARPVGQIAVACSIGILFTPETLLELETLVLPILLAAFGTIPVGLFSGWLLSRLSGMDLVSAGLASVPIGPVESANLAGRLGRDPGPIIFSQTLRIVIIVVIIPATIIGSVELGQDAADMLRPANWTWAGVSLLALLGCMGAAIAIRVRLSNPYFLGPLAATALAAMNYLPVTPLPFVGLIAAQILLGAWLGAAFDLRHLSRNRRQVPAMLTANAVLLTLCLGMAVLISLGTGIDWHVTVLGTAPGGVTEMALSAKILGQGVTTVIAFHVVRVFVILPIAPWLFGMLSHRTKHHQNRPDSRVQTIDRTKNRK